MHGRGHPFGGGRASIAVYFEEGRAYSGVCIGEEGGEEEHARLRESCKGLGGESSRGWPCFKYVPDLDFFENPGKHFQQLASEAERQRICDRLVTDVGQVWQQLKDSGLA